MKKILVILLLVMFATSFSLPAFAAGIFDRIPMDKWAHMFGNAFISEYAQNKQVTTINIVLGITVISLIKETHDYYTSGRWDWQDIMFNLIGMGIALLLN